MRSVLPVGLLFLIFILMVQAEPLWAEARPEVVYEYYPVRYEPGKSPRRLIAEQTPLKLEDGRVSQGWARWQIKVPNVTFRQMPEVGICRVQEAHITLHCTIILPELYGGDDQARREFDQYAEKIRRHELDHLKIAEDCAAELKIELMNLGDRPCDGFADLMQATYDRLIAECKAEQKRYDKNDLEFHY